MRISGPFWFALGALAACLPLLVAAAFTAQEKAPAGLPGAGVLLETAVVEVTDKAATLKDLASVPEAARWATVKNNSAGLLYVGARTDIAPDNSWPLTAGEEFSFSLASPVYLRSASGTIAAPVLFGR